MKGTVRLSHKSLIEAIELYLNTKMVSFRRVKSVQHIPSNAKDNPSGIQAVFDEGISDKWKSEAVVLIKEGRKISAIKLCRAETGLGLKEAKDAIDQLESEMKAEL